MRILKKTTRILLVAVCVVVAVGPLAPVVLGAENPNPGPTTSFTWDGKVGRPMGNFYHPDFPVLLVVDQTDLAHTWFVILDARNGKSTRNASEDPTVVRIEFRVGEVAGIEVDQGFLTEGKPNRRMVPYDQPYEFLFEKLKVYVKMTNM